jgi:hypothetical protein
MNRDFLLWTPILISPSVWFLTLAVNFALAPLPCGGGGEIARRAVSSIALLITAAAGVLALSLWRRNRLEELPAEGAPIERVRAMTIAGIVLSAGFFLVIAAQALPDFILAGCE